MALCASASGRLSASTARPRGPSSTSLPSSFVGAFPCAVAARTRRRRAAAAARATVTVRAEARKSVLIVNTNGGGHAVIGFYFAKELLAAGHAVTVLTVGDEASDKMKKPPFSRFSVTRPIFAAALGLGVGGFVLGLELDRAFDGLDCFVVRVVCRS
jgi:hypothetical protein